MSTLLKNGVYTQAAMLRRSFSCTASLCLKQWRVDRGLPVNRTSEGVLTDGPDYTFLDGRPTPLLHKQKIRMERQRHYASRIVKMCSELDFAKDRYQKSVQAAEEERQNIIANRLKPKGSTMLKKK